MKAGTLPLLAKIMAVCYNRKSLKTGNTCHGGKEGLNELAGK